MTAHRRSLRFIRAFIAPALLVVAAAALGASPAGGEPDRPEGMRLGALPPDGYWAELAPPLRAAHAVVFDPVRRRLIVIAGWDGSYRGDVWALSMEGEAVWTRLEVAGPGPGGRMDHTAIYDPSGDRVLVFGGRSEVLYDLLWFDDVWELSLAGDPTWTLLEPQGERPQGRARHTSVYDPARRRMVVFGGFGIPPGGPGQEFPDAWAFELEGAPRWTRLVTSGTQPVRSSHVAVYDAAGDRMVIHGGSGGRPIRSDAWTLSLASGEWEEILPGGAAAPDRESHTAVFDPVRRRLVFFGGVRFDGEFFVPENDVWALSLAGAPAWSNVQTQGTQPSRRGHHAMAYDHFSDRIVISGGLDGQARGDVWTLPLSGTPVWVALRTQEPAPVPREGAVAAYDPVRKQILLFGGRVGSYHLSDLWALPLVGRPEWRSLPVPGSPDGRQGATLTYDPRRDRFLLCGGFGFGPAHDDLWQLTLPQGRPTWTRLAPIGPSPAGLGAHSAIYDPLGDRLIVFGGMDPLTGSDELWALDLEGTPRWTPITPVGEPPPGRSEHTAIYDPVGLRMIVFGGFYPYWNDAWELSLAGAPEWRRLSPLGSPPTPRRGHTAAYDPANRRMLVFGGRSLDAAPVLDHNELWELSLDGPPAWRLLAPEGPIPLGRMLHAGALDPRGNRMIVFGGESDGPPFAFTAPTWQVVLGPAPPVLAEASVAWDRVRIVWQSFGGAGEEAILFRRTSGGLMSTYRRSGDGEGRIELEDTDVVARGRYEYWAEQNGLRSESFFADVPGSLLSLMGARPNPAHDQVRIALSLASADPARLELFDLRGSRVFAGAIADPRPGVVTIDLGDLRRLPAGVYLARVTQGGQSASGKLALIR